MIEPFTCADLLTIGIGEKRIRVPKVISEGCDQNKTPLFEIREDYEKSLSGMQRYYGWLDYKASFQGTK